MAAGPPSSPRRRTGGRSSARRRPASRSEGPPASDLPAAPAPARGGRPPDDGRKHLNLALQGGGAHGALTWGVLDRLLADERIAIDGITGTSAGAMNAAALVSGYAEAGACGARARLELFWSEVSRLARGSVMQRTPLDWFVGSYGLDASPAYLAFDVLTRFVAPVAFNPLGYNPLRDVVARTIDFSHLRACTRIKLFVAATNVRSGKVRVFRTSEVTLDAVMASACLPQLFAPVEIDGEAYWDGGFMGNPPLFPLFYETDTPDTVLVQINPVWRAELPRTGRDIVNRVNEITFNSSLLRELRAVHFVTRLIEDGKLDPAEYMRVRMHRISTANGLEGLSASSKYNAEWRFLTHLRDVGRAAADRWLAENFEAIGVRDTLDLAAEIA